MEEVWEFDDLVIFRILHELLEYKLNLNGPLWFGLYNGEGSYNLVTLPV